MISNLADLIGIDITLPQDEEIYLYDSVNGKSFMTTSAINSSSGQSFKILGYQVVNDIVGNKLWLNFEDPLQVTWAIYDSADFLYGGAPLIIDPAIINASAPSIVSTVFNGAKSAIDAVLPKSLMQKFNSLTSTFQTGFMVGGGLLVLFIGYKIYKLFKRKK